MSEIHFMKVFLTPNDNRLLRMLAFADDREDVAGVASELLAAAIKNAGFEALEEAVGRVDPKSLPSYTPKRWKEAGAFAELIEACDPDYWGTTPEPESAPEPQPEPALVDAPVAACITIPTKMRRALEHNGIDNLTAFQGRSAITAQDLLELPKIARQGIDGLGRALKRYGVQLEGWPFPPKGPYTHRKRRVACKKCGVRYYPQGMAKHRKRCDQA